MGFLAAAAGGSFAAFAADDASPGAGSFLSALVSFSALVFALVESALAAASASSAAMFTELALLRAATSSSSSRSRSA